MVSKGEAWLLPGVSLGTWYFVFGIRILISPNSPPHPSRHQRSQERNHQHNQQFHGNHLPDTGGDGNFGGEIVALTVAGKKDGGVNGEEPHQDGQAYLSVKDGVEGIVLGGLAQAEPE